MESLAVGEIEDRRRVLSVKGINQAADGYIFINHYKMYLNVSLVRILSIAAPEFYVSYKGRIYTSELRWMKHNTQ